MKVFLVLVLAMLFADVAQAGGFGGGIAFRQRSQVIIQRQRVVAPVYQQQFQFRQQFNSYAAPLNFGYQQQFRSLQFNSGGYCDPGVGQFNGYGSSQLRLRFGGY